MTGTVKGEGCSARITIKGIEATIISGPGHGATVKVPRGDCLRIGRGEDNDLRINDPSVSERHCELRVSGDGWVLYDRSTNGTHVNGLRVREMVVEGLTRVMVGAACFEVQPIATPRRREHIFRPPGMLGESPVMLRLFDRIRRVSGTDLSVLLTGETGTGKELAAQELHRLRQEQGRRGDMVVIDCTNLPSGLAESLLLGHKKGSFTGATADRLSPFEAAAGGTVFLDEVGDLPFELQGKLLRVVQGREVQAIGSHASKPVDVRLVAATHRDLGALVEAGKFRADLYYRLCESIIRVPALRERGADVFDLAESFLSGAGQHFDEGARISLTGARWPGNVRQLRAVVRRASALHPERVCITTAELFDAAQPEAGPRELSTLFEQPWELAKEEFARHYWTSMFEKFGPVTAEVAARAEVSTVAVRARRRQFEVGEGEDMMARPGGRGRGRAA